MSAISRAIKGHWTVPPKHRTPEQDEAEEHLLTFYLGKNRFLNVTNIKFSRWYLFVAAFVVQFCIGSLYSWSVFNKPIDQLLYNNDKAEKAVNAFYTAVGVFGTTTAIMGPWIERNGPRAGVCLGTSAFFIGNVIVAISLHYKSFTGVVIGYGIFCGFGMGLCYISPVSALQKWFPDYRGTAAGFAVGGYGAGAVVWGKAYLPIIRAVGLSSTFLVIAFSMCSAMFVCAIILRSPHHDYTVSGLNIHGEAVAEVDAAVEKGERISVMSAHEYESIKTPTAEKLAEELHDPNEADTAAALVRKLTLIEAIKSVDFIFMYIMFFANQLFGLIVLSKLSGMCVDLFGKNADQGANIVSINGVFNCCGRLLLPAASDFFIRTFKLEPAFGRKCIFFYTLTTQVIIVGTLPYLIDNKKYTLFVAEVFILTASYGGGFGSIPAFLTDMFGAYNIGAMHGLILTSWSIGGVVGGITFNNAYRAALRAGKTAAQAYQDNIHVIFIIVIIGFVFIFLVRTNPKDRFAGGYRYSIFGLTIINIKPRDKPAKTTNNGLLVQE
jgi:MFS family permease